MSTSMTMARRRYALLNAEFAEHAERVFLCGLCALCVLYSSTAFALVPVRTMYTDALAREQAVRGALAAADASAILLPDVRAVVAAYEAVVAKYPASGYSDNALWQGGRLALEAFVRFGQTRDRDTGVRLLRRLAATYPTSKLAKQVPDEIARFDAAVADEARPARPAESSAKLPAAGAEPAPPARTTVATIKEISRAVLPDAVRITIEMDGEVPFHDERIADPARVFVDLPGTRAAPALVDQTIRFDSDADVVRQVRIGRHPNNTTRIVLDAAGVTSYSVYPLYSPYRLVIDCVRGAKTTVAATPPAPAGPASLPKPTANEPANVRALEPTTAPLGARRLTADWLRRPPAMSPRATKLLADAFVTADTSAAAPSEPAPIAAQAAPPPPALSSPATPPLGRQSEEGATAARKNLTGGFSIARQLGLSVSRIVIDAGHGGHDPGAKGRGVSEAELVLDVALRLEKLLQKVPGVEVILTRRTDEFIPLPERTAIANREGADLFLSIHANASQSAQARGVETYFLNFATNLSAAAVAARENAASSQAMGALPDFVKAIALNNKLDESRDFATQVQRAMFDRLKTTNKTIKDLGVKQAPFVVLIGAAMPSVLAEIAFVTNAQEAKLLKGNAYRQRIADALFNAIRKYQTSLKNTTTVAHQ